MFSTKIVTIYIDGGGEYQALKSYFQSHGINHLQTPPHTPQHNGAAERRGLTLLHTASLPSKYWSSTFQAATFLINRLPTLLLKLSSPYVAIYKQHPIIFDFVCSDVFVTLVSDHMPKINLMLSLNPVYSLVIPHINMLICVMI